jgi:hypothetical protein
VAGVDENGNTGQLGGNYSVVVDEMIVGVKDGRAIDAQLAGDFENRSRTCAAGLLKRMNSYARPFSLRS